MAGTIKRIKSGDAANIFVRCMLSDISDLLGGFSKDDLEKTVKYFDYKCPYTGEDISVEYKTGKWVLDHLIPHNRESVGLNLYGNIIVTTRTINAAKAAKAFEDFIRFETKGTDEEKERRIQKIRNFQQDSGYFDKIKNIDEIKELCKKEYDAVQNKLREHIDDYKRILEIKNENFVINPSKTNTTNSSLSVQENPVRISKTQAIQLLRDKGINIDGQITFSSKNAGVDRYWANPSVNCICYDWWLILNDINNKILYTFFIPANSISIRDIVVRADNSALIDIQINYNDNSFIDSRSKIDFHRWLVESVTY